MCLRDSFLFLGSEDFLKWIGAYHAWIELRWLRDIGAAITFPVISLIVCPLDIFGESFKVDAICAIVND